MPTWRADYFDNARDQAPTHSVIIKTENESDASAEDPLDVGDHLGIDGVSFCGPRQPHERHRSALTDDHAVRQVPRGLIDAAVHAIPRSAGMPAHSLFRLLSFRARSVAASWIKHSSRLRC